MLVLTRKPGQSILIGDGIEVQVLSTAGEKVRLGITAPRDVPIFRDEVKDRIDDEAKETERAGQNGSNAAEPAEHELERLSQRP
jgi:carbon storage regulator